MGISAVRGAIQVERDEGEAIRRATGKMYERLLEVNHLSDSDIACALFTQTSDLRSMNPAGALRRSGHASHVPLFCMQELEIEGMMERVIRVLLILKEKRDDLVSVYLDGAERLRPDLRGK